MSTHFRPYYLIFIALVQLLHFFTNCAGQHIEARVVIDPESPHIVHVTGRFTGRGNAATTRNLSFIRTYAGIAGLGERVRGVVLKNGETTVSYQAPVPGEYVADSEFTDWNYSVDLTPRKEQNAAAHLSWLWADRGILMFGDLLPIFEPNGSKISAQIVLRASKDIEINSSNIYDEVVVVGKDQRSFSEMHGDTKLQFEISENWLFSDEDVKKFADDIYEFYKNVFVNNPVKDVSIRIVRFPGEVRSGVWQADTRGRNITIVSSDMPFKTQSLQRLHEQMRHEMFHLWIPNGVNLSGNYDWFYEGFALYSSLKLALAHNRIRFEDFLDTLSRAHAIDARQVGRLSLLTASGNRFSGSESYIYARGMVAAFLCDLVLLSHSKGKSSVFDVLREIYTKYKYPEPRVDGNTAVISIMRKHSELLPIVDKYVDGSGFIEWENELSLAGIEYTKNGLAVMTKLNSRQKDLLNSLGYNNWRRLSQTK
jgi:hypothetical protein